MSNTRIAEPGKPLRQERWSSSEEFERGLLANLVARRCQVLKRAEDRELIHFLQLLSHREGGLQKVAADLGEMFPSRIGTRSMQRFGMKQGQVYNARQAEAISSEIPSTTESAFPVESLLDGERRKPEPINWMPCKMERLFDREGALSTMLPSFLEELCLNPAQRIEGCEPWYFPDLIQTLRDYQAALADAHEAQTVVTEVGRQTYDTLDYALQGKCLVLIEGQARIGKTFAAKAWCAEALGKARYVQVPSTNDEGSFFRAIAKALGVCCGRGWKVVQLRQRIEDVLQTGDLILVMDEAHYLWPVSDCRHNLPGRINWIMTALVNHNVPVALVTTPQFIATQKAVEKRTHWTSEQFIGRIGHYLPLPNSLSDADLVKVAKVCLPEGDARSIEMLVRYAQGSAKYLAGIESVVRRARYLASKEQRQKVGRADVKRAIKESVIPSDSALADALSTSTRQGRRGNKALPEKPFNDRLNTPESTVTPSAHRAPALEFSDAIPSRIERGMVPV